MHLPTGIRILALYPPAALRTTSNNLLTVIGQSHLLRDTLGPQQAGRAGVDEVIEAADRAAALPRQLVGFARRHPRRAACDRRERTFRPRGADAAATDRRAHHARQAYPQDVRPVRIDPGQFEQLLVNLAVNARDAMPDGGRIIIETANVVAYEGNDGPQVRVTVIDDGAGIWLCRA